MVSLKELKDESTFSDLFNVARLLEESGLSCTVPFTSDGAVSLPYAIAAVCGVRRVPYSDDFTVLVDMVPGFNKARFIRCWECLEIEFDSDLVIWSESAGLDGTVRSIRSLAKTIELS